MQNPANIRAYPVSKELAVAIYQMTRDFPRDERFGLTSQIRRASVSIGSNIAEGCGRQGDKALISFIHFAIGSANELQFQLELAVRLRFTDEDAARDANRLLESVRRMLVKLVTRLRTSAEDRGKS